MTVELLEKIIVNNLFQNKNLIIDGPAGSGKSTLIRKVKKQLGDKCIVTAVTGIASKLIDGKTISSQCRLKLYDLEDEEIIEENECNGDLAKAEVLIIDEVSMQKLEELRQVDLACRSAKRDFAKNFGGIRVILFGDQAQLRPITVYADEDRVEINDNTFDEYKKTTLQSYGFHLLYLTKIYRQKDKFSQTILNKIRAMIIEEDYTKLNLIDDFLRKKIARNTQQVGVNLYSNSKALPAGNMNVDEFYFPTHAKERAPYEQLPLVEDGIYQVTQTFRDEYRNTYINGETIQLDWIHDIDDFETSFFERVKIDFEERVTNSDGDVIDIIKKKKTVYGDLLYTYAPLMLLTDATTRRVQGSTLQCGNIGYEFFTSHNRVRHTSIDGWLRTLYVALSRFESLHNISFVCQKDIDTTQIITSGIKSYDLDEYQIQFIREDYGGYSFKILINEVHSEVLTNMILDLSVRKVIEKKASISDAIDGLFDKLESIVLQKEFYLTESPRGDLRVKTIKEWKKVSDKLGWKCLKKGTLSQLAA